MRTYRPATIAAMILVLAASLAACSSDSSTTVSATSPSDSAGALGQAIDNVCGKLTDASTAVAAAQAGQTGELSSSAQTLAADLDSAAALLQTLGVDAAPDVAAALSGHPEPRDPGASQGRVGRRRDPDRDLGPPDVDGLSHFVAVGTVPPRCSGLATPRRMRVAYRPGLPCMIPPSAKMVVAVT